MAFQFPWTNFHELNLDWFLSKFKQFTNNYLETTATAESVPYNAQPSVTVTGGDLDDDTDIVDPFTFNFKIPAGQPGAQGAQGVPGVPGQDGFSPVATVTKSGNTATISITDANGTTTATLVDGGVTQEQLDTKAPAILNTVYGSIAGFPDGADNMPVNDITIEIDPVQSGSGDPAPDNIRPISGWTGATLYKTRTNLINQDVLLLGTSWTYSSSIPTFNGVPVYTGTLSNLCGNGKPLANEIPVNFKYEENTRYRVCYWWKRENPSTANGLKIQFYYTDGTSNSSSNQSNNTSNFIRQGYVSSSGKTLSRISLTYNSSSTVYIAGFAIEKYDGTQRDVTDVIGNELQTNTINWVTDAGTVYGGSLDVTTGVLTVDMANIASYNGETLPGAWISDRDVYAQGTTPTTGAQVVYELATPQSYQLTPQQVVTLLGVNNIWCDTGDTTVVYTADTKKYIQNLTQPSEDDMIANTAIASGTFFMIGNNLYRASTAIASGSQIIPGTNATALSLADALNLL